MCISQSSRLDYVALKIISGINDYTKKLFKRLVKNTLDLTRSNKSEGICGDCIFARY